MAIVPVADVGDPRLLEVAGLTDAEGRRRLEAGRGTFVAEGLLALDALARSRHPLRFVLTDETKLDRVVDVLGPRADASTIYVGTRALLRAVAGFAIHRGVVASGSRLPMPSVEAVLTSAAEPTGPAVLVAEGINDHENMGALFRNAAAFGAGAVLLDPGCADPLYRRSVRVSVGHVLHVPWTRLGALPHGLDPLVSRGLRVVALSPDGEHTVAEVLAEIPPGTGIAWVLGAEGPGLSAPTRRAAHHRARIPLADGVDSLNVATAAAVALALGAAGRPGGQPSATQTSMS